MPHQFVQNIYERQGLHTRENRRYEQGMGNSVVCLLHVCLTAMVLMPLLKDGRKYISMGRRVTKTAKQ